MSSGGTDPRDPNTILQTCQSIARHFVSEQIPRIFNAATELPSKTWQRYMERDRSHDARQGAVGDPFRGWIDPGLADGIDERRKRYEEYLQRKREAKEQGNENAK
ncbi:uncharacterized protein MYCFIDRAFT_196463 [Pseudocercospora fijiensis CIRAD86]|uniref:Uncharacterized protein n=1 Tax=Pseudocercospora fijiensis (strain CIRAD86) TaxID=383855 RepID=M3B0X2_PSEFD|nr:uncharacterized protein MYCFIDRAFT_196463 [Pseudocercospora fijiensis CIRAD86]EME83087.1 hypothetical protein MYCFIDRAFT_196463 [Pseudocercospora fijiensis CIRAD86]